MSNLPFFLLPTLLASTSALALSCYDGSSGCIDAKQAADDCLNLGYSLNEPECEHYLLCPFNTDYKICVKEKAASSDDCPAQRNACEVGYVYYNDYTCSPADQFSVCSKAGRKAVGVVTHKNQLAISLSDIALDKNNAYSAGSCLMYGDSPVFGTTCNKTNINYTVNKYQPCGMTDFAASWHLPELSEFRDIWQNMEKINSALNLIARLENAEPLEAKASYMVNKHVQIQSGTEILTDVVCMVDATHNSCTHNVQKALGRGICDSTAGGVRFLVQIK